MRAVLIHAHGDRSQIHYTADHPDPVPGEGEVVLRVAASAVNYHDIFTRRGMPGITIPLPVIVGSDIAGTVERLGPGVSTWRAGDRVLLDPVVKTGGRRSHTTSS